MKTGLFIVPSLLEGVGPMNAAAKAMAEQMSVTEPEEVWRLINRGEWVVRPRLDPLPEFDPALWFQGNWKSVHRHALSQALGPVDYTKVVLVSPCTAQEWTINGEERQRRLLKMNGYVPLSARHYLDLRLHPCKIPPHFRTTPNFGISCDGDTFQAPAGRKFFLTMRFITEEGRHPIEHPHLGWEWRRGGIDDEHPRECLAAMMPVRG